jgi:hypothetical protein
MVQSSTKKIIINYCITKDYVMIKFDPFIPGLKGQKGKQIEGIIRKNLIETGVQIMNWTPILFVPQLPKIEGQFEITIDLAPKWKTLKERLLKELNK